VEAYESSKKALCYHDTRGGVSYSHAVAIYTEASTWLIRVQ